jgi:hypothetical protein
MASAGHPLTGADHFHLLIDRQMRQKGLPGNISRIHLHLAASADLVALREGLETDPTLKRVAHLRLHHHWPSLPKWTETNEPSHAVFHHGNLSQEMFRDKVLNSSLAATSVPVRIDLCMWNDGSKHLVLSMHHALFDHRGMTMFLHAIATGQFDGPFFIQMQKKSWKSDASDALQGMFTALGSAGWLLATLASAGLRPQRKAELHELSLSIAETTVVDANALELGAGPGRSAFYLGAALVALREILDVRGQRPPYFWFPVPHDMRRKGGAGHLVGNDLSFLFFKVRREDLVSVRQASAAVQSQLTQHVRKGALRHQAALQRVFRRIPFWLMNAMVGLTTGGRVSSLAFSDLGEEKNPIKSFLGEEVLRVDHIPPVPFPPGLSVVFKREAGKLRLILAHLPEVIPHEECQRMADRVVSLLKSGGQ